LRGEGGHAAAGILASNGRCIQAQWTGQGGHQAVGSPERDIFIKYFDGVLSTLSQVFQNLVLVISKSQARTSGAKWN
jgi:hypothetical protein